MKHINDVVDHQALITHLMGASNYTWLHFRNGTTLLLSKPLSSFEILLPNFIRIHKTALVNPAYVDQIKSPARSKTPGAVQMLGGAVLPVSRRRWNEVADLLQNHRSANADFTHSTNGQPVGAGSGRGQAERETSLAKQVVTLPNRQICAVLKDDVKGVLLQQILEEKWPHCTVRFFANGASLIDYMTQTAHQELPALVLLDVRAVSWSGLSTLEAIKLDRRLRLVPTVVFINNQSGNDIEVCYAAGANSVIPQLLDSEEFARVIRRICQYWLSFAALPTASAYRV